MEAGNALYLRTLIIGDKFHWQFSLKEKQKKPLQVLVKVKLLQNLKSPFETEKKSNPERVSWRFEISPEDVEVSKTLQLIDICGEINF